VCRRPCDCTYILSVSVPLSILFRAPRSLSFFSFFSLSFDVIIAGRSPGFDAPPDRRGQLPAPNRTFDERHTHRATLPFLTGLLRTCFSSPLPEARSLRPTLPLLLLVFLISPVVSVHFFFFFFPRVSPPRFFILLCTTVSATVANLQNVAFYLWALYFGRPYGAQKLTLYPQRLTLGPPFPVTLSRSTDSPGGCPRPFFPERGSNFFPLRRSSSLLFFFSLLACVFSLLSQESAARSPGLPISSFFAPRSWRAPIFKRKCLPTVVSLRVALSFCTPPLDSSFRKSDSLRSSAPF